MDSSKRDKDMQDNIAQATLGVLVGKLDVKAAMAIATLAKQYNNSRLIDLQSRGHLHGRSSHGLHKGSELEDKRERCIEIIPEPQTNSPPNSGNNECRPTSMP